MRQVAGIALVVIATTFIVCGVLTPQLTRSQLSLSAIASDPASAGDRLERSTATDLQSVPDLGDSDHVPDTDAPTDLYGNEVTDAVAKYKTDAGGSLYEVHSPQTELPHLGSPKS